MIRYALAIRDLYEPIEREKRAQVEENIAAGEAAPVHNTLKTSPAQSGGSGPAPRGLPSSPPAGASQAQVAPQQGAMPPAAPPSANQVQNLDRGGIAPPVSPLPNTSVMNRNPMSSGKAKKKSASREEKIARLKKMAISLSSIGANISRAWNEPRIFAGEAWDSMTGSTTKKQKAEAHAADLARDRSRASSAPKPVVPKPVVPKTPAPKPGVRR